MTQLAELPPTDLHPTDNPYDSEDIPMTGYVLVNSEQDTLELADNQPAERIVGAVPMHEAMPQDAEATAALTETARNILFKLDNQPELIKDTAGQVTGVHYSVQLWLGLPQGGGEEARGFSGFDTDQAAELSITYPADNNGQIIVDGIRYYSLTGTVEDEPSLLSWSADQQGNLKSLPIEYTHQFKDGEWADSEVLDRARIVNVASQLAGSQSVETPVVIAGEHESPYEYSGLHAEVEPTYDTGKHVAA